MSGSAPFGRFAAPPFVFALDDGFTAVDLSAPVEVYQDLSASFPEQGAGAALASWLLARLAYLADGGLALEPGLVERVEGGVYVIEFVVLDASQIAVAKLQLQAGAAGAALLGVCERGLVEAVVGAWRAALSAAPEELAAVIVEVEDPADGDRRHRYGRVGGALVGA